MIYIKFTLATLIMLFACSTQAEVPSSVRSKTVVAKVEPTLKEALSKEGLKLGAPVLFIGYCCVVLEYTAVLGRQHRAVASKKDREPKDKKSPIK